MARVGVTLDPDAKVADLSIANRQLVAICRAMAADARFVIMDEPTSSLTRHEVDALLSLVRDLKAKGITIMFVSHRLKEVMEVAERVTVLRDGRKVGTFPAAEMDDKKLGLLMTGKAFAYELKEIQPGKLPVALAVSHLSRDGRLRGRELRGPCRRDSRHHRPPRLRPHRARALALRHDQARFGHDPHRRQGSPLRHDPRRRRARHRLRAGGPAHPRPRARAGDQRQYRRHRARRARRAAPPHPVAPPRGDGAEVDPRPLHPRLQSGESGEDALRRQPAARRHRQVDGAEPQDPHPRQPDRRRRHQRQGRHLRDRRAPCRRGRRGDHDLRRDSGGALSQPPGAGDARGPHHAVVHSRSRARSKS